MQGITLVQYVIEIEAIVILSYAILKLWFVDKFYKKSKISKMFETLKKYGRLRHSLLFVSGAMLFSLAHNLLSVNAPIYSWVPYVGIIADLFIILFIYDVYKASTYAYVK